MLQQISDTCSFYVELKEEETTRSSGCCYSFQARILTDLSVVDGVEEDHRTDNHLEVWSNASTLGLHIFVLPSPESTAAESSESFWVLVATR